VEIIGKQFVPSYDSDRIYSAFVTQIQKHGEDEEVSKDYALLHLAWHDQELFEDIRTFLLDIISKKEIDGPFIQNLRRTGLPTRDQVIHQFWLGAEGLYSFLDPYISTEEEVLKRSTQCSSLSDIKYGMLSKREFESKHAADYKGLSKAQKAKRFADYKKTSGPAQAVRPIRQRRRRNVPRRRNGNRGKPQTVGSPINPSAQAKAMSDNQIGGQSDYGAMDKPRYTRGPRRGKPLSPRSSTLRLSKCGALYITGLINPFMFLDATAAQRTKIVGMDGGIPRELPCVPLLPSVKSKKGVWFIRGSITTGAFTNYVLAFAPRRAANNYSPLTGDLVPLIMSNGIIDPGTTFPVMDQIGIALIPGYTGFNFNTEYPSASVVSYFTERLVCGGVRIRYAGSEVNQSGIVHAFEQPNHFSATGLGIGAYSQYESYFKCPVSKKWCTLTYNPVYPEEYQYMTDAALDNAAPTFTHPANNHFMGFVVQGLAPGALIEYEAMIVMEVVGPNVRDLTPSSSDMKSMEVANNNITPANQQLQNENPGSILKTIMNAGDEFTTIVDTGIKAAKFVSQFI